MKQFLNIEKRLQKEQELYKNYSIFMTEHFNLGHREKLISEKDKPIESFYLPHHLFIPESSITMCLRVILDGSAKTTTGVFLNGNLIIGSKIQQELFFIFYWYSSSYYKCRYRKNLSVNQNFFRRLEL